MGLGGNPSLGTPPSIAVDPVGHPSNPVALSRIQSSFAVSVSRPVVSKPNSPATESGVAEHVDEATPARRLAVNRLDHDVAIGLIQESPDHGLYSRHAHIGPPR